MEATAFFDPESHEKLKNNEKVKLNVKIRKTRPPRKEVKDEKPTRT